MRRSRKLDRALPDSHSIQLPGQIDVRKPGIYLWRIVRPNGVEDAYVGKATKLSRRMRAYPRNVRRLADGLPYHNGGDFRLVHHALRQARDMGWQVVCIALENCQKTDLNAREAHWIVALAPTLNGPAGRLRLSEMQRASDT